MTGGKKWLLVVTEEQAEWIKDTSRAVGLKGSDIVREILNKTMNENPNKFKAELAQAQVRIKLQALNDKRAAIDEEAKELQRSLKEKVLA